MTLPVLLARIRMPLLWAAFLLALVSFWADLGPAGWALPVLLGLGMLVYLRLGTVRREPVTVRPPLTGRWVAINSPADKVPSHGLHAYGQTYAIDLVHEPEPGARPAFNQGPAMRPPAAFPAFGQPVLAPADATVVRVHDRERDHLSRNSWLALPYLLAEGFPRELSGPSRIVGNHVVLDLGGGVHALLAHLKRGSIRVRPGQRVAAGEQLAECGNSGNSSEPHLHFQLMDSPRVLFAAGLPFRFEGVAGEGLAGDAGVPANGKPFVTTGTVPTER
jgi:hypothetical protein